MNPLIESSLPRPRRGLPYLYPPWARRATAAWLAAGLLSLLGAATAESQGRDLPGARDEIRDPAVIEARAAAARDAGERAFWEGRRAYSEGNLEAAVTAFRKVLQSREDDAAAHFWLGQAYGRQASGEGSTLARAAAARRSRRSFEEALELDPDYLEPRLGLVRFHLAAPALVGGSVGEAEHQAREIARRDPHLGHLAWGGIFEHEESWEKAEASYRRALRTEPEDPAPYLRLVWMFQSRRRFDEAFAVLKDFASAAPEEPRRLYELGRTAAFSGRHRAQGQAALEAYLALPAPPGNPSPAEALCHLGMIQRHGGDNEQALTTFRRALSLDRASAAARRNVEELEALLRKPSTSGG